MGLTNLSITSNRFLSDVFLTGAIATVAADAAIAERFQLPTGFGDLALHYCSGNIGTFSGVYVAPTPAYDGMRIGIVDANNVTVNDEIGTGRFVSGSSSGASLPTLFVSVELFRSTILRQGEAIVITAPILAGAGVTVTVGCRVRGVRLKNS